MKTIVFILIILACFQAYSKYQSKQIAFADNEDRPSIALLDNQDRSSADYPAIVPIESTQSFRCDGRTYCSQMTSCAEATYFLRNCPGVKMDGDGDGVACERQWCN
jgi:hypothetical protein